MAPDRYQQTSIYKNMSVIDFFSKIRWQTVVKIVCLIAFLVVANILIRKVGDGLYYRLMPGHENVARTTIAFLAALYSVLLAIPFVPGAEIGLAMIAMVGPHIVFLVYFCTIIGLSLSFFAGRLIPSNGLIRFADDFKLHRTSELLKAIEPLDQNQRLSLLANKGPSRFVPFLLRHRHLALAVALNIPGNILLGGGGGIALFAGVSRIFSVPGYLLTIALSVAPVPIAVLVLGSDFLAK